MSLASAEVVGPSWYPTPDELSKRPKFSGAFAIDPLGAHEIDDAIHVTFESETSFHAEVHVADAGLLAGTDMVAHAREKGWSRYFDDGTVDLMLPPEAKILDLHTVNGVRVPAVTISFGFSETGGIGEVDIVKSRIHSTGMQYSRFAKAHRHRVPFAVETAQAAQLLATHTNLQTLSSERFAEDVVGRFMVIANFIVAGEMDAAGVPWLFRSNNKNAYTRWANMEERRRFEEMRVALYGANVLRHDSLGLKRYCHFTSPLRRRADLTNHINFSAYKRGEQPPYSYRDMDDIAAELTALYIQRSRQFDSLPIKESA